MLKTCLYRVYQFSSAHRLNSPELDKEKNWEVYDKCNNLNGHGHDYFLEVGVSGPIIPDTGMIIDLELMDNHTKNILDQLNYKHLNNEVPYFKNIISTGENIIEYLWNELDNRFPDGILCHLKLWETNNNYFELKRN
ncbi:6-carboxytetrahydropterin synthase [Calditrichota bacterium]